MIGGALLDRIAEAGATASLDPDGRVRIAGASRLPAELLDLLRQNRVAVAEALARREADLDDAPAAPVDLEPDPIEAAERAAMAEHHAAPPADCPWRPGDPDPLRDGLLAGWRAAQLLQQRLRLAAVAARLRGARPKRVHGVRQLDWAEWEAAARAAADLPTSEWAAWRARFGRAEAAWPPG